MSSDVQPFHSGGLKIRTVALFVCFVMLSSAIPILGLLMADGTHSANLIQPIQDEGNDYARYIQVNNFRFDPLVESPNVPDSLSYGSLEPNIKTYRIVQFNGPVTQQMKQDLGSTGMQVLYYINYNAFVVMTDGKALEKAKSLPSYRWSGVFEPAYKLSPRLSDSYEQMLSQAVERNIEGVPGTVYSTSSGVPGDPLSKSYDASSPRSMADGTSSSERISSRYQASSLPAKTATSPAIDVLITTFERSWVDEVARTIAALGGTEVLYSYNSWGMVRAVIDKNVLTQLAREPGVMWIDRQTDAYIFNDIARWVIQSADMVDFAAPIHEQGIWGTGQTVTVGDTGIDYDHNAFRDPDYPVPGANNRKVTDYYIPEGAWGDSSDNGINHGSHVSGTVAGDDGIWHIYDGDPTASNKTVGPHDGQAFDAKLQVQDLSQDGQSVGAPNDLHDLFQPALDRGSYIHTNSWGSWGNDYVTEAAQTDDFLWYNQDFIVCFAAGNSGSNLGSINPYATAKNVIGVGATSNGLSMQNVASFSSRGPAVDGRIKPDVMAPGSGTWSVDGMDPSPTQNTYKQLSGTSMATPTVAGAVALIRQYYMDGFFPTGTRQPSDGFTPSAALVKATLINSAAEMTGKGAYANGESYYPNDNQGWGRVLLDDGLYFQNDARGLVVDDRRVGLSTAESVNYNLFIGDNSIPIEITLVWTDYPGLPMSSPALVNDLNLVVTAPDGTVYRGNAFQGRNPGESTRNPALNSSDHLNNVESVLVVTNPQAGLWKVTVSGFSVPVGPQSYAIVMSAGLATDKGTVRMDKNVYKSSATVNVRVVDLGLNADPLSVDTVDVNMSSTTETTPETVLLTETGVDTSVFVGSAQLQNSLVPIEGDGLLQVLNRDNITAEYFDEDDGLGGSGPTYDYAVVDDEPPVISGVQVIDIRFNRATVVWTTDEASNSVARFGDSLPPNSSLSNPQPATSHRLLIRILEETTSYYFSVESADEAGNLATDDNGGAYYEFTTTGSPPAPIASEEWPTFQNNVAREGKSPGVFSPPIEVRWESPENYYSLYSSPTMADGILFATSLDGYIRARDPYTGDLLWQKRLGDRAMYTGVPTVVDGTVYITFAEESVNDTGGTVYALDEITGDIIWSTGPEAGIDFNARIAMAYADGLVFGAAWSGEVFAMDASSGAIEWVYETGDFPFGGIVVDGTQVLIGTTDDPRMICLDEFTGGLVWERTVDSEIYSAPMVSGGFVYVGTGSGTLYCINEWTGTVVWSVGGFGWFYFSTPASDGVTLYFTTGSGRCYAVDASSGTILWDVIVSYTCYGSVAYANGFLYMGAYDGKLVVLDASDGSPADSELIGLFDITSSPSVSEGWAWIADNYGSIHAFMGQMPAGLLVWPSSQTRNVIPSSEVDYTVDVTSTGSSGPDTFDALVTPGALGWGIELFMADSVTPLPDTDGDSVPDTGSIVNNGTARVVVRVTVPGSAIAGDREQSVVTFRSSIDLGVDKDARITSMVPMPGVDIGPRSYFMISPDDVRTAWMNVTNTGAFTDTIDITALPTLGWNLSLLSEDGVTPLQDTDADGLPDTGPMTAFARVSISIRVEVPSDVPPGTLERVAVTGWSSLDVNASDSNVIVLERPTPPSNEWPTFHDGNQRQGASPSLTSPPLDREWVAGPYYEVQWEGDWVGPVFADGTLFSTYLDGSIRAHDAYTGAEIWSRILGGEEYYTGTPAVEDGIVYITFYEPDGGSVYALDELTGNTVWSFGSERGMMLNARTPMLASNGLVFGTAWSGEAFAVDAYTGAEVWRQMTGYFLSGAALSGGALFFGTYDGYVLALDEFTGDILWSTSLDLEAFSTPMCAEGMVYVGTSAGSMYALDSITGDIVWESSVGQVGLTTPAYDGSNIYFGATVDYSSGYFYALDAANGSIVWSTYVPAYVEGSVAYANGYVFGVSTKGTLYSIGTSSGYIADTDSLDSDGSTSSPAVSNGWVWVQDWDGSLYGFRGPFPFGVEVEPTQQEMSAVPDSSAVFTITARNIGTSGVDTFDVVLTQGPQGWPVAAFLSDGITPLPDTDSDGIPDTGPVGYLNETSIVVEVSVPVGALPGDQEYSFAIFTSSGDPNASRICTLITTIPPPGVMIRPGGYRSSSSGSIEYYATNVTNTGATLDVIDLTYTATSAWPVTLLESDGVTLLVDHDGDGVPDTSALSGLASYPIVVAISVPDGTPLDSYFAATLVGTSSLDTTKSASARFRVEVPGPSSIEWPTYQHDAARKGSAPQLYDLPLTKMWTYDGRGGDSSGISPIVAQGVVYYTSSSGDVIAVDGGSGEELWVADVGTPGFVTSSPTYSEGKVFVGYSSASSSHGAFSALSADSGIVLWTFAPSGFVDYGTPVTSAGVVYFSTNSGTVYALDSDTGDELWEQVVPDSVAAGPSIIDDVLVIGGTNGSITALDLSGNYLWNLTYPTTFYCAPSGGEGTIFVAGYSGHVYAIDSGTGTPLWTSVIVGQFLTSAPAYNDGGVFIADLEGDLYALDAGTGDELWHHHLPYQTNSPAIVDGSTVYQVSGNGILSIMDASSGDLMDSFAVSTHLVYSPMAMANGALYVIDKAGSLSAFGFAGRNEVASLEVTPATAVVQAGGVQKFDVIAKNKYGGVLEGQTFTWTIVSGTGSLMPLDGAGASIMFAAGLASGTTILQVSVGAISTQVQVLVPPGDVREIIVSPSDVSIAVGSTAQFIAVAYDALGNVVAGASLTWSSTIGGIDSSGLLSSGTGSGEGIVTASFGSVRGDAIVHVLPGPLDHISVTPGSLSIVAGGMSTISIVGEDQYGNEVTGMTYTWSSTIGMVYPLGGTTEAVFQAGTIAGSGVINVSCGNVGTEIPVGVVPGPLDSLVISPSNAALEVDESQTFAVAGFDAFGNAISGLTIAYSVSGGIGSIDNAGVFTAGTSTGKGEVIAASGGLTVAASVTVGPGPLDRIAILSRGSVTLTAGSVAVLDAIGYDSHGNSIDGLTFRWSADFGSMMIVDGTSEIIYQAGTSVGSRTVTVTNGSVRSVLDLAVVPGPLAILVVDPASLVVDAGDSVDLTVRGYDAYGNLIANLAFAWAISSTSSTNEAIGTLTVHADTKVATLVAGDGAMGTITVTCGSKSAVVSVTVNGSPSTLTKAAPGLALAAIVIAIALAVLLILMFLGKLKIVGRKV